MDVIKPEVVGSRRGFRPPVRVNAHLSKLPRQVGSVVRTNFDTIKPPCDGRIVVVVSSVSRSVSATPVSAATD